MTIAVPTSGGWRFEATLEQASTECSVSNTPSSVTGNRKTRCLLSAALQTGWRIMDATPAELALLEAHRFGSRRLQ